jgi:hypothetical protein
LCQVPDGALSMVEWRKIIDAAAKEIAVGGEEGTRFFEKQPPLMTGRPEDAARGLGDRMCLDHAAFFARMAKISDAIEDEAREFHSGSAKDVQELQYIVNYVINSRTSEKVYPNGIRDQGRDGKKPTYFTSHRIAQAAGLLPEEVHSLRIYTTFAYKYMNNPLRDDDRYSRHEQVPLPIVSHLAAEAIKKLRGQRVRMGKPETDIVLWRGMRNTTVTADFMKHGGTELAFMSTTSDLSVAVRYALSPHSLLFKIVVPNFMSCGAELHWLSAFSNEKEVLFPPLTYLQPTGQIDRVDAVDRNGNKVSFTVIKIIPSLA